WMMMEEHRTAPTATSGPPSQAGNDGDGTKSHSNPNKSKSNQGVLEDWLMNDGLHWWRREKNKSRDYRMMPLVTYYLASAAAAAADVYDVDECISIQAHGGGRATDADAPTRKEDLANLFGDDDADRYAVGDDKRALFESFKTESSTGGGQKAHQRSRHQQQEPSGKGGIYYANDPGHDSLESKSKSQERALAAAQKAAARRSRDSEGFTWKKATIGLLFLSLFSAGALSTVFTIYDFFAAGFKHVDINDAPALRQVLLSGDPALVYCFDKSMKVNKVPPVLKEADRDLRGIASTYTMDCHEPLPDTGKSIYQKYKFSSSLMPAFVVANGDRPIQLNPNSMASPQTVVEFTKANTKPIVRFAKNAKQLDGMCLSRQRCLLIGYRHKFPDQVKKVLRNAMKSHRGLRVVALDTSKYRLKLDPAIVPLKEGGGQRDGKSKKGR
ncbi:hypothetical protein FOZ63_001401, partial [Perkinsus olseni]